MAETAAPERDPQHLDGHGTQADEAEPVSLCDVRERGRVIEIHLRVDDDAGGQDLHRSRRFGYSWSSEWGYQVGTHGDAAVVAGAASSAVGRHCVRGDGASRKAWRCPSWIP